MPEYLFHLELPVTDDAQKKKEVAGEQEEHINQLFVQGKMRSYSVDATETMIWCVLEAASEQEAMDLVSKFPIYPLCTDVVHHTLHVNHNQAYILPDISLN
jgi:muconolactone delta-isomerase